MSLREIKEQARRDLHNELKVTAYCYRAGSRVFTVADIRVHNDWGALGDVKGTSFVYAERRDTKKQELIFLAEQFQPKNQDVIMVGPEEGYMVDDVDPTYNITIRAGVISLPANRMADYIAPPIEGVYSAMRGFLLTSQIDVVSSVLAQADLSGFLAEMGGELA
jgi:hypothetical protein